MRTLGIAGVAFTAIAAAAGAGGAPIVIDPADDFFFDDFDGTNASLTGRAGWTASGDATKAGKIVADNGVARMLTATNGDSPWGYQFTANPGEAKFVEFEYDYTQHGSTLSDPATPFKKHDQRIILAWTDESNYTYADLQLRPSTLWRLSLRKIVSGAPTDDAIYEDLPNTATVKVRMTSRWRVWVNGKLWAPDQLFNDAAAVYPDRTISASAIKTGGAGFRHSFHPVAFAKMMRVNPVDITITDPEAGYGRDPSGSRSIGFAGTYTGTPVSWAWRLRNSATGIASTAWAALSATAGSGAWSATLTIPTGIHLLDVAWIGGDGKAHVATSTPFAVGIQAVAYGQSNAAGSADSQNAWTSGNDPLVIGDYGSVAYAGSSYDRLWSDTEHQSAKYLPNIAGLAKSLSAATGVPVIVSGVGVPGNALETLKPGTTHWNTLLVPLVARLGYVEQWIVSQGEAEALSSSSSAAYAADFAATVAGFRSIGGHPNAGVFVRLIGEDTAVAVNSTTTTRAANFRALQMTLENPSDKIWVASHPLGVPLTDNIHFTALGHIEMCRREGLTIARRAYGALAYDGRGPVVTGATSAGAVITLAVDLNGATGISGSALTGYTVSADNFTTALTISSVNVSGSTIVITLAADPGGPVKVGSYREASYDNSSIAIGAYADGTTIPVMPIAAPVTTTS